MDAIRSSRGSIFLGADKRSHGTEENSSSTSDDRNQKKMHRFPYFFDRGRQSPPPPQTSILNSNADQRIAS
jgi:hypothetical protein